MRSRRIVSMIAAFILTALPAAAQTKLPKVYISVDMEGIWGVVHGDQTAAGGEGYASARKWMAEDVNAVIAGLREAGAGEIVVNDSHGGMKNIIADALDPTASLVSGTPKPLVMMEGVDASFDAVVFVGYHAQAGSFPGILDHTISGATVYAIKVNGRELPEMGLNAAIAGYFKVPVIMLTGDTVTCGQARYLFGPDFATVAVKDAVGRLAARMLPRSEALAKLKAGAKKALENRAQAKPFVLVPTLAFELEFHNSGQSELPMIVPGVKRLGPRSVGFSATDYLEGFKLLRALIALGGVS
ncbi:MAG: peptidase M55 [Candidatus Aminicenantes bacterium]|nr:peptidase M55 [Candidatus Aminicenantes bacterium]